MAKGWFRDLLGIEKATEVVGNVASKGMDMLDEHFDTDQEKREHSGKVVDAWLRLQEIVATQSSPTSTSRRKVAWGVVSLIWLMVVYCLLCIAFSKVITPDDGLPYLSQAARIEAVIDLSLAFKLGWAFCTVIVFYFGPHLIGKLAEVKQ